MNAEINVFDGISNCCKKLNENDLPVSVLTLNANVSFNSLFLKIIKIFSIKLQNSQYDSFGTLSIIKL